MYIVMYDLPMRLSVGLRQLISQQLHYIMPKLLLCRACLRLSNKER